MKTNKSTFLLPILMAFLLSGCADPFSGELPLVWEYWDRLWTPMSGLELSEHHNTDDPEKVGDMQILFGAAVGDVHFYDSFIFMDMSPYSTPQNKDYINNVTFIGKKSERFWDLCKKHNDYPENNRFKQSFFSLPGGSYEMGMYHFYKDFEKLEIYCNEDFDERHPAGTSLLDIVHYATNSPSRLLDSGYKTKFDKDALNEENYPFAKGTFHLFDSNWSFINIWKKGDNVQSSDLKILSSFYIAFDKLPTVSGPKDIIITMIAEDGEAYRFEKNLTFERLPYYDEWNRRYILEPSESALCP